MAGDRAGGGQMYLAAPVRDFLSPTEKGNVHNVKHKTTDLGVLQVDTCCGTDDGQRKEKVHAI